MNIWTDPAGKRHSHITIEWHRALDLAEVTDTSPAAYARKLGIPLEDKSETKFGFATAQRAYRAKRMEGAPDSLRGIGDSWGIPLLRMVQTMEHADLGVQAETLEYCRIEMGVTRLSMVKLADGRKEVIPPYACVVGERFTGEWGHRRRPFVLLDEATSLEDVKYPDLDDFIAAVIALKDIYHGSVDVPGHPGQPVRIYCSGQRQDLAKGTTSGPADFFFTSLQRAHGLTRYDRTHPDNEIGRASDDADHARKYPFFLTMDHIGSILEPPFVDDEDLAAHKLNALFAHNQLEVRPHCGVYDRLADAPSMPGPKLALAYAALAMEYVPWAEEWRRRWQAPTGYDLPSVEQLDEMEKAHGRRRDTRTSTRVIGGPLANDNNRRRMAKHVHAQVAQGSVSPNLRAPQRRRGPVNNVPGLADVLSAVNRPGRVAPG